MIPLSDRQMQHVADAIELAKNMRHKCFPGEIRFDEDQDAESAIALIEAIKRYNPAKSTLKTYLYHWIKKYYYQFLSKNKSNTVSLNQLIEEDKNYNLPVESIRENNSDSIRLFISSLMELMPRNEYKVFSMIHGLDAYAIHTMEQVMAETGLTKKSVYTYHCRAIKYIKKQLPAKAKSLNLDLEDFL